MARIDDWGCWPVVFVWFLATALSVSALAGAMMLEDEGAELAAAVMTATIPLLVAGAMVVTWRWLSG